MSLEQNYICCRLLVHMLIPVHWYQHISELSFWYQHVFVKVNIVPIFLILVDVQDQQVAGKFELTPEIEVIQEIADEFYPNEEFGDGSIIDNTGKSVDIENSTIKNVFFH